MKHRLAVNGAMSFSTYPKPTCIIYSEAQGEAELVFFFLPFLLLFCCSCVLRRGIATMSTTGGLYLDQSSFLDIMQSQGNARSGIAALSFLVWDILISLGEEVEYIWLTPWAPLKLLFFFTRYYSLIVLTILNSRTLTCKQWIVIEATSAVVLELAVEILLILRIYAMYSERKYILRTVVGLLVVQIIIMITTIAVSMPRVTTTPNCIGTVIPVEMVAYSVTSILYEAFLFILAIVKFRSASKIGLAKISLLRVLVRDNMWTFLAILVVMIMNTVLFTIAPATLAAIGFPWALATLGALGPRLMLNVRREHKRWSLSSHTNGSSISGSKTANSQVELLRKQQRRSRPASTGN
ncbi:hypothetical protein QCA50_011727 [Cerrena zonata]|uniref:DUF6533 domain-containing protein n=1 Tax=Cerrena zonata TaxID=2478898 RepID=A0AAW0G6Q5_9APHY